MTMQFHQKVRSTGAQKPTKSSGVPTAGVTLSIPIAALNRSIRTRAARKEDVPSRYAEDSRDGATFPPIVVIFDVERGIYYVADGEYRIQAQEINGHCEVEALVYYGAKSDAIRYALGSNCGEPRDDDDRKLCIRTALESPEWATRSSRAIAALCGVRHQFVEQVRREFGLVTGLRIGKDGKQRRLPTSTGRDDQLSTPGPTSLPALSGEDDPNSGNRDNPASSVRTAFGELCDSGARQSTAPNESRGPSTPESGLHQLSESDSTDEFTSNGKRLPADPSNIILGLEDLLSGADPADLATICRTLRHLCAGNAGAAAPAVVARNLARALELLSLQLADRDRSSTTSSTTEVQSQMVAKADRGQEGQDGRGPTEEELVSEMLVVLRRMPLTAQQILSALTERKCVPNTSDPLGWVRFVLASHSELFCLDIPSRTYRRRNPPEAPKTEHQR